MKSSNRINSLSQLGFYIQSLPEALENTIILAGQRNQWFTKSNCEMALSAIAEQMLQKEKLEAWITDYSLDEPPVKTVGIIAASNIPAIAFHDILSVLIAGHKALIKLSERDQVLIPHLLKELIKIDPEWANFIEFQDRWSSFDAVIATGSNNTGRYFEQYFGKYPNIIRKNRHSVAILDGSEDEKVLQQIGHDVFDYFGLGCRNVSLLYLPEGYDVQILTKAWHEFDTLMDHHLYKNNFDYQRTLYLMNQVPLVDCDFVNMVNDERLSSPIGSLHLASYRSKEEVAARLDGMKDQLQCVVNFPSYPGNIAAGQSQQPGLSDYADGVDTLAFLSKL